ncbi:MAG: methyl-accepting chemotaxis protein [Deltaproteobacteria bacterium]|jgi:methyl-accepting chemotaxis protein|nr:methyl-accepting chemotaxis protein [Deltaproteobacteria bacterium]MBW2530242.1 methyl-accepting chemotaxis protein [Deltaproteobacteria bacterium]
MAQDADSGAGALRPDEDPLAGVDWDGIVRGLDRFRGGDLSARLPSPPPGTKVAEVCGIVNELLAQVQADQDRIRDESMELAMGLSEHLSTLAQARSGDLSVRAAETSPLDLVARVGKELNAVLATLEQTVKKEQEHSDYLQERTQHLLGVLSATAAGETGQRAAVVSSDDEMGKLCAGINTMLDAKEQAMEELHRTSLEIGIGVSDFLATLQAATAGDMTARPQLAYDHEAIGTLARVINKLMAGLEKVTSEIVEASDQLDSASVELLSSSQHQSKASSEQAAALTQSASSIEELAVAAREIEDRAAEVHTMATDNVAVAEQGQQAVAASASAIEHIGTSTNEAAKRITALGEKSMAITEVTEIIDGIASQTNLLALNAAIEAARAGDAGRGFSVVAVEIRKLAENVVESTKEIKGLIKEIQDSTSASVLATEEVIKQVDRGAELSAQVAASLDRMLEMLRANAESAQAIQSSTSQQTAATDDMAKTVKELTGISQDAANAARESFESAQELSKLAGNLRKSSEIFKRADGAKP